MADLTYQGVVKDTFVSDTVSSTPVELIKNGLPLERTAAPAPIKVPRKSLNKTERPARFTKKLATKQLVFYSKHSPPAFTYDIEYDLPIKKPNELIIEVRYAGLNPADLQIINTYNSYFNKERGIGREYSGVVLYVGENLKDQWKEGDEVCGLYFHQYGLGTLASAIQIDPSIDPLVKKPENISWEAAGSWMFTFGTAWSLLQKAGVKEGMSVLVIGGSSSVGLMLMQLLKQVYKCDEIFTTCSGSAVELVKEHGAKIAINYRFGDVPSNLKNVLKTGVHHEYINDEEIEISTNTKKFDLIIDCVGGTQILRNAGSLLKSYMQGGKYFTIVGDQKADYTKDTYGMDNTNWSGVGRGVTGMLWGLSYNKFWFYPTKDAAKWMPIGADLLNKGQIENVVDSVYPWKDFSKAKEKLEKGHARGKIVMEIEKF